MKIDLVFPMLAVTVISACGFAPSVDHHQHLMSPAAVEQSSRPALRAVELPQDLARLLTQRAERWRDAAALKELYTSDAWVLSYGMPGWGRGPDALSTLPYLFFGAEKLTPVLFRTNGSTSSIAGYYTRGEGAEAEYIGNFHMTVERTPDGVPLIASETPSFPIPPRVRKPVIADDLISMLDDAGIRRAVVLSNAYFFDGLIPVRGDAYAMVRAENDWTAEQVMRHPDRLVALCSFNPTKDYALAELERCSKTPAFTGVKLHFGTSGVDLDNPEHVAKTRRVFEAANRLRLPLLIHTAATPSWGKEQAETFLNQLVAAAPDVQVVVAHLWGGAFYSEPALDVFAGAVSSGNPVAKNLYFEVASAKTVVSRCCRVRYGACVRSVCNASTSGRMRSRKNRGKTSVAKCR
jgi:predicted TIM-barrel fold metal-dependent hydrolase